MNPLIRLLNSSIGKKYLMALTGLIWAGFVLGHMVGNLQIFLHPYWINSYAYKLQHIPYGGLWVIRLGLLAALVVHVVLAVRLTAENRAARPESYREERTVQATWASRYMILSGGVILAFFLFHIAHYTVKVVPGQEFGESIIYADGTTSAAYVPLVTAEEKVVMNSYGEPKMAHDVYNMMVAGFQRWWVSAFYLVAVFMLMQHLRHGISSMFQTLGLRNENTRVCLNRAALAYGVFVFLGFAVVPIAIMSGIVEPQAISLPSSVSANLPPAVGSY
jgi:succinate dehydrogenase / fumarate reductase, cytochrome b subunit